ncbi:MAG TPA: hypothetical protein PLF90_00870 [bacterium]|nr:hypothetical protein [bacterium]
MFKSKILFLILFFIFSFFFFSYSDNIKLAIIDIGKDKVPKELFDFIYFSFNNYPEIALIEREEIEKIFKEQQISISFSGENVIEVGKLLFADSFLMIELRQKEKKNYIRFQLVETHYGIKLWSSSMLLPDSKGEYGKIAEDISKVVSQRIKRIKIPIEELILLGLTEIRSEEITRKWDYIGDELKINIEEILSLYPEVILLERKRTGILMEERDIVKGLPEKLISSAIYIDGSYRINREKKEYIVEVYIRGRQNEKKIFEIKEEGEINKLSDIWN